MPYSLSVEYQLGDSTPIEHGDVYVLTKDGLLPGDKSKYVYFHMKGPIALVKM
jgi:hypothetical protein